MNGRIIFDGNPWPEGHPIKDFVWSARVIDDAVWYDFHLETMDYNAERDPETFEDVEHPSDWEAPGVWNNFHTCILSSTYWPGSAKGFPAYGTKTLQKGGEFSGDFKIDCAGEFDWEAPAFCVYLLGHDAVSSHRIQIVPSQSAGLYDIDWTGKIALAYIGEEQFKYRFRASIKAVEPPKILGSQP